MSRDIEKCHSEPEIYWLIWKGEQESLNRMFMLDLTNYCLTRIIRFLIRSFMQQVLTKATKDQMQNYKYLINNVF